MSDLKNLINNFINTHFEDLNDIDKEKMNNVMFKLTIFENSLFSTKSTVGSVCIAHQTNPLLCEGDGTEIITRSHINPENQFKKLRQDYTSFMGFSVRTMDILKGPFVDANLDSGRFIGFCQKCEEQFAEHIDTNLMPDKAQLALSAFRYLGKSIYLNKNTLALFKNIQNLTDLSISANDLSFFLKYLTKLSLDEYIIQKELDLIKAIIDFHDLKLYWKKRLIKNGIGKSNLMDFKVVKTKDFVAVAQSLASIPLFFLDSSAELLIFIQFQYDEKNKETICHFLTYGHYLDKLKDNLKSFTPTSTEWAKIFLILALKNNQNFYFIEDTQPFIKEAENIVKDFIKNNGKYDFYNEIKEILILLRKRSLFKIKRTK